MGIKRSAQRLGVFFYRNVRIEMHAQRDPLLVSDNGSESFKVYDGTSRKVFLRQFCYWCQKPGCALLAICPRDTDPLLDMHWTAQTDVRYYGYSDYVVDLVWKLLTQGA